MKLNWFMSARRPGDDRSSTRARAFLARLGPTWAYSPLRRACQVSCLIAFVLLFFVVARPEPGVEGRAFIPVQFFLSTDVLVAFSASLAGRIVAGSLLVVVGVLLLGLVVPRWFCGYACPLGTLIDIIDRCLKHPGRHFHVRRRGWWVHIRFYLLGTVVLAAGFGVMVASFVSPIPVLTRGLLSSAGMDQVGPLGWAHFVGIALLAGILALSFLGPRFWCRNVCPTGALLSIANLLRLTERKVSDACIGCGRCERTCSFDAVRHDYTTRSLNCTFCQECGGACPVGAISFEPRRRSVPEPAPDSDVPVSDSVPVSRRGFIGGAAVGVAAAIGLPRMGGADEHVIRPPGSLPEERFLGACVRCGECVKACPTGILQPAGASVGLPSLWTPHADPLRASCDPDCTNCGSVCPTGAIRHLPLEEKREARMGLAVVDETCIQCFRCISACPYNAIVEMGPDLPVWVRADRCVGCGACENTCHMEVVLGTGELDRAAIRVHAGEGRDDRIVTGSYVQLHRDDTPTPPPEDVESEIDIELPFEL